MASARFAHVAGAAGRAYLVTVRGDDHNSDPSSDGPARDVEESVFNGSTTTGSPRWCGKRLTRKKGRSLSVPGALMQSVERRGLPVSNGTLPCRPDPQGLRRLSKEPPSQDIDYATLWRRQASVESGCSAGKPANGDRKPPPPLRPATCMVRLREFLCGPNAFFSLFGWRFLRRSMIGIWRVQLTYTGLSALFVGIMVNLPTEHRLEIEGALRGFTLLFDFTRVFLVFTLTAVVGTMYKRWWEMRKLAGTVAGRTTDITMMIATYIQGGDDTAGLKCDLVRYLNLAHVLVHIQARGKRGRDKLFTLDDLAKMRLISQEEQGILVAQEGLAALHPVVYMWFTQLFLEAMLEGLVPSIVVGPVQKAVLENINEMRRAGSDIFMHQNTPPPIGYFRVLYLLLNISLFISPLGVYAGLVDKHAKLRDRWMVVPVSFVISFFLLSFIHMCYEMFDPFADGEGSHFPLRAYLETTMRTTFALLEMPREGRLRYYGTHYQLRAGSESEQEFDLEEVGARRTPRQIADAALQGDAGESAAAAANVAGAPLSRPCLLPAAAAAAAAASRTLSRIDSDAQLGGSPLSSPTVTPRPRSFSKCSTGQSFCQNSAEPMHKAATPQLDKKGLAAKRERAARVWESELNLQKSLRKASLSDVMMGTVGDHGDHLQAERDMQDGHIIMGRAWVPNQHPVQQWLQSSKSRDSTPRGPATVPFGRLRSLQGSDDITTPRTTPPASSWNRLVSD